MLLERIDKVLLFLMIRRTFILYCALRATVLQEQDIEELKRFIVRRKPHVIAVSGENLYVDAFAIFSVNIGRKTIVSDDVRKRLPIFCLGTPCSSNLMWRRRCKSW